MPIVVQSEYNKRNWLTHVSEQLKQCRRACCWPLPCTWCRGTLGHLRRCGEKYVRLLIVPRGTPHPQKLPCSNMWRGQTLKLDMSAHNLTTYYLPSPGGWAAAEAGWKPLQGYMRLLCHVKCYCVVAARKLVSHLLNWAASLKCTELCYCGGACSNLYVLFTLWLLLDNNALYDIHRFC